MASMTRFLEQRLKLKVNPDKSAVDGRGNGSFWATRLTWRQEAAD